MAFRFLGSPFKLLCGSTDGKVKLWNVASDQVAGEIAMPSTYKRVTHIQCNPQADMFAVSSGQENIKRGGTLTLWDFAKLQTIVSITILGANL
jgi:WD40 repeat protein